jgi:hypothetical protein
MTSDFGLRAVLLIRYIIFYQNPESDIFLGQKNDLFNYK